MEEQIWLENFKEKDWDWDFKKCYTLSNDDSGIVLFLKYKLGKLNDNTHPLKYTKKYNKEFTGFSGDCDKEVYPMYNYLNWQEDFRGSVRGETMNSFSTTFHRAVYLSGNRVKIYEEIGIDQNKDLKKQYDLLLENNNYQKFSVISKNLKEFERFAQLTQTIGDFTVLPNWMNTGRGCSKTIFDYWDLTLKSLYEFLFPLDAWETFVNKYYLHPFLDKNLKPMEFWDNHFYSSVLITKPYQIEQFLFRVNKSIEERGKYLKRKLDNIEISEWPRSSEELWIKEK
ncbi:hypothetical protein HAX42_14990 [Enterococcus casseliflavus]|nr:hypothetical protein [Enterococcus casseliflavus]